MVTDCGAILEPRGLLSSNLKPGSVKLMYFMCMGCLNVERILNSEEHNLPYLLKKGSERGILANLIVFKF